LPLVLVEPTHHRSIPTQIIPGTGNHCSLTDSNDFCNNIGQKPTNRRCTVLYQPPGAKRFRSRWGYRCRPQYNPT